MICISLSKVSFAYDANDNLFNDLSCTIGPGARVAIIGDNGAGKTTLLKIMAGEILPDRGAVVRDGYCVMLGQSNINLNKSGGQSQMDALAAAFDSMADVLLLDEPTNNLDTNARNEFYRRLRSFHGAVVIVSHDRQLLNMMDNLLELRDGKLTAFGGNYDFYVAQRRAMQASLESKYIDAQKNIAHLIRSQDAAQTMRQHHQAKQAKERANKSNGSKLEANSMRGKSQETEAKRRKIIQQKLAAENATMQNLATQMRDETIKIPLGNQTTYGKDVVMIENMVFGYNADKPIFNGFDLHIRGGDKLRLVGNNGSGKTTLLKLICGVLRPTSGSVRVMGRVAYLDQNLSLLDGEKTIAQNIADFANIKIHDAHAIAANFGFRGDASRRVVKNLSGGELLKATLAAVIGSDNQPDLLILDEPTNSLDIKSTIVLEDALRAYRGAVLLVSHDAIFAENVGIENKIVL